MLLACVENRKVKAVKKLWEKKALDGQQEIIKKDWETGVWFYEGFYEEYKNQSGESKCQIFKSREWQTEESWWMQKE